MSLQKQKGDDTEGSLWATGDEKPDIQKRFDDFHRENPRIFELFRRFAQQAKNSGHDRYSADAILHRIRWHVSVETRSVDGFKLNDHFTSRYARKLMAEFPDEFGSFFELRNLKS